MGNTMKLTSLLLVIAFVLVWCANESTLPQSDSEPTYTALLLNYSDAPSSVTLEKEYDAWSLAEDYDVRAGQTMTVSIDGKSHTGKFEYSIKREPNNFTEYVYVDNDGNHFYVDEQGNLTACRWEYDSDSQDNRTEKECLEIAKSFFSALVDPKEYQVEIGYVEWSKEYSFYFYKELDGYRAADWAIVYVHESGQLSSFLSRMLGKIPANTAVVFDKEKVTDIVRDKLDTIYVGGKNGMVEYTPTDYEITILEDGTQAVIVSVKVTSTVDNAVVAPGKVSVIVLVE